MTPIQSAIALTFWFAVGAAVGSFLSVCLYRIPAGLSLVRPSSHCPTCSRGLRWYENVPIASWLAQRGRCRGCAQPISPRYLLVECATGLWFCTVYLGALAWRSGDVLTVPLAQVLLIQLAGCALVVAAVAMRARRTHANDVVSGSATGQ
jgi:leader peptidase (prepilin peptidase)/N-methyltransferase